MFAIRIIWNVSEKNLTETRQSSAGKMSHCDGPSLFCFTYFLEMFCNLKQVRAEQKNKTFLGLVKDAKDAFQTQSEQNYGGYFTCCLLSY